MNAALRLGPRLGGVLDPGAALQEVLEGHGQNLIILNTPNDPALPGLELLHLARDESRLVLVPALDRHGPADEALEPVLIRVQCLSQFLILLDKVEHSLQSVHFYKYNAVTFYLCTRQE